MTETIEIVDSYKYLGLVFSKSGSLAVSKRHIAQQGVKAMYALITKARQLSLPVDIQIDLFNKTVKPISLYGCEIWCYGNIDIIERVQLKFLKTILNLKSSTPSCMVYGETGVLPLSVDIYTRVISFWGKLCSSDNLKLSSLMYNIILSNYKYGNFRSQQPIFKWIDCVRGILTKCGNPNIWDTQQFPSLKWLKLNTKQKLTDLFLNEWYSFVQTAPKYVTYKLLKESFGME